MQQSTACLHFAWCTTSLRVGGRAARRSCLPGLRCGGGRLAGAAVLSCLVWRCELIARQVRSASECVRRSHCAARHTPTQTGHRTHLPGCRADSVHTATPDTTKQSRLRRVWRGVEVCMGMGKTGIPWVPWDSRGNGCKISHGMGMRWEWELSAWEWELRRGSCHQQL